MPTQDLVHYRSENTYPVVRGNSSDNSSSLFIGSGAEDWVTRKRVETKTTKNIERRVQRQVVLEDGRVIEEDDPEIIVDTIEDVQSHDEDDDEARQHYFNQNFATTPKERWVANGDILSETNRRNIYTKNISQKSVTTASARNLGEISSKDVDKVIRQGKRTRQFIRPNDDDSSSTDPISIPAKVIHTGKSNRTIIDREDVREVSRLHDGKVKTERHVAREMVEDTGNETPEEGDSTEETESRDGDRDGFAQRKEERFVDYYRVPKGKTFKEGQFLGHGIHMTSYDKNDQKGQGVSALMYNRDDRSDSTPPGSSGGWPSRPPRSSDHQRRKRSTSSGGRKPSGPSRSMIASSSTGQRMTPDRYNTVERSSWKGSSREPHGARSVSTLRESRDQSSARSRSMSQSPQPFGVKDYQPYDDRRSHGRKNGDGLSHHRSMATLRSDLDDERESRLKRAMSFSSKSVGPIGAREGFSTSRASTPSKISSPAGKENPSVGSGLIGSVKSLYATMRRKSLGKENAHKNSKDQSHTDNGSGPPQRPPRKHQSSSSVTSGHSGQFNSLDRSAKTKGYQKSSLDKKWTMYNGKDQQNNHGIQRQNNPTSRESTLSGRSPRRESHQNRYRTTSTSSFVLSPGSTSSGGGGGGGGRHRSHSSRLDEPDNRDPPRFEPERHRDRSSSSRFFGQSDESDSYQERSKPPPDMRRLLLNNVNLSRSKSMSKDLDSKPSVIRAF